MPGKSFLERVAAAWPLDRWRGVTVVAAVSGGADSIALLRALAALTAFGGGAKGEAGRLVAAHFHHRLRGSESDADAEFVASLAAQLNLECVVGHAPCEPAAWNTPDGLEAAARAARYAFLAQTARQAGARYVATAHTADDQAETVLHRIVRGTGIAGLAGIPRARPLMPGVTLMRPLLTFRRRELRDYLHEIGQPWREDASNANHAWTRNRIRGALLPALARDYNPEVVEALVRLGDLARDAQEVIDAAAQALLDQCLLEATATEARIDARPLLGHPPHLVCECFLALWKRQNWPRQRLGRDAWRRLAALVREPECAAAATIVLPGAVTARRQGNVLTVTRPR